MEIMDTPEAAGSIKRKKKRKQGRLVRRHTDETDGKRGEDDLVRLTDQEIAAWDRDIPEGIAMMDDMYEVDERRR